MKIKDYELICDVSFLFGKTIFVYGTGVYGRKVAETFLQMETEIEAFCETDPEKEDFGGKPLISPISLIQNYDRDDVLVVIASEKYYKEMICAFQTAENLNLCTYYALFVSLYLNYETKEMTETIKKNIELSKKISLDMAAQCFFDPCRITRGYCEMLSYPSLVWLYQPGKVGSMTIHDSSPSKVIHLHSMAYAFNADGSMYDTYNLMLDKIKENPVKIITGVREPISRDISTFFQGTDVGIWPFIRYDNSTIYLFGDYSRPDAEKLDVQLLKKKISVFEKSLNHSFEHMEKEIVENKSDEFSWFDYEIKALFGVDIYEYPFDKEKGYALIKQDNIQILVYKCEKLNQLEKIIGDFLEDPDFLLQTANRGEEKVYSYIYKRFKEEVKINQWYFDYYYANNLKLKHFYTDLEIEQFIGKWKERLL